jgi:hypothetical protein
MRLEVTALVTMQFSRYAEAAEEVGDQSFCYCRCLLIRNGVHFRPLGKIIHSNQEISVSLVASWERPCYVNGYSFKRSPDIILVHFGPHSWSAGWDWLHSCHTVGAISQYLLSLGASRISVEPYSRFCYYPSDRLMVHHVVRSARPLLCSEG